MLRKFAYNKIFRTTGMLLLFLLLILFPASKEYTLDDIKTVKTSSDIKKKFKKEMDEYLAKVQDLWGV